MGKGGMTFLLFWVLAFAIFLVILIFVGGSSYEKKLNKHVEDKVQELKMRIKSEIQEMMDRIKSIYSVPFNPDYKHYNNYPDKFAFPAEYNLSQHLPRSEITRLYNMANLLFLDTETGNFVVMYAGLPEQVEMRHGSFIALDVGMIINMKVDEFGYGYFISLSLNLGEIVRVYFKSQDEAERAMFKLSIARKSMQQK
jgi:hypothetical protein